MLNTNDKEIELTEKVIELLIDERRKLEGVVSYASIKKRTDWKGGICDILIINKEDLFGSVNIERHLYQQRLNEFFIDVYDGELLGYNDYWFKPYATDERIEFLQDYINNLKQIK